MDPTRTGSMLTVVNTVSQRMGTDVADWPVDRLLQMLGQIERAGQQRS